MALNFFSASLYPISNPSSSSSSPRFNQKHLLSVTRVRSERSESGVTDNNNNNNDPSSSSFSGTLHDPISNLFYMGFVEFAKLVLQWTWESRKMIFLCDFYVKMRIFIYWVLITIEFVSFEGSSSTSSSSVRTQLDLLEQLTSTSDGTWLALCS